MRISVALGVYNGSRYLAEQWASLVAQARQPDEVVVGDDRSTDDTPTLVAQLAATSPFPVRFERNAVNLGSTANFGRIIARCAGDVIACCDQDDRWHPAKLARIEAEFAARPDLGLVFTDANLIDDDGRPLGTRLWRSVRFAPGHQRAIRRGRAFATLLARPVVTGATMAFRADHRAAVLPIPPGWVHDEWIALVIAAEAPVAPIADPLIDYRRHLGNQVGVGGTSAAERARTALDRPNPAIAAKGRAFADLRDRLRALHPNRADLVAAIEAKIHHFEARGALPRGRFGRLPIIARELFTGRYGRYSGSSLASVRDLLA